MSGDPKLKSMGAIPHPGGVGFRVWAPHAQRVSVIGSFNNCDGGKHPMRAEENGHWFADIAEAQIGDQYRYLLTTAKGKLKRIDPYARQVTGSVGNAIVADPIRVSRGVIVASLDRRKRSVVATLELPSPRLLAVALTATAWPGARSEALTEGLTTARSGAVTVKNASLRSDASYTEPARLPTKILPLVDGIPGTDQLKLAAEVGRGPATGGWWFRPRRRGTSGWPGRGPAAAS